MSFYMAIYFLFMYNDFWSQFIQIFRLILDDLNMISQYIGINYHLLRVKIQMISSLLNEFIQNFKKTKPIIIFDLTIIQKHMHSHQTNQKQIVNVCKELKEGNILLYSLVQNTTTYQIRVAHTSKGLWVCIQQSLSNWKLTITDELIKSTVEKVSAGKSTMTYREFTDALLIGLKKSPSQKEKWSIGVMTPVELQMLRNGSVSKQHSNNKIYLILSDVENRLHYPYTLQLSNMDQKVKLVQAIKKMKTQLDELRATNDKSQSSFSLLSESTAHSQHIKIENQELKKKIKMYEDSLTQKRGAVEIDMILRQKNTLQIQFQTRKREQAKQILKMKNVHTMLSREINEVSSEVDLINRQLALLEDSVSNPAKLKSHAMRVLKNYQVQLRNSKKVLVKQNRQIEALKRNINNSKNTEKRLYQKIKQIQTEIEQAKKKANTKEISNRLHGSQKDSSVRSTSKAPSIASRSDGKSSTQSYSGPGTKVVSRNNNLVRQNLLKRTTDMTNKTKTNLLKTTPNIQTPNPPKKSVDSKDVRPPARPVLSSHNSTNSNTNYNSNRMRSPARVNSYQPRNTTNSDSGRSNSRDSQGQKKKELTPEQKARQKLAIQRLSGAARKKSSEPLSTSNANKPVNSRVNNYMNQDKPTSTTNLKKPISSSTNLRRDEAKSLNANKPFAKKKVDSSQQILNRMKEIKAQYNARSQNIKGKQDLASKVEELTK